MHRKTMKSLKISHLMDAFLCPPGHINGMNTYGSNGIKDTNSALVCVCVHYGCCLMHAWLLKHLLRPWFWSAQRHISIKSIEFHITSPTNIYFLQQIYPNSPISSAGCIPTQAAWDPWQILTCSEVHHGHCQAIIQV